MKEGTIKIVKHNSSILKGNPLKDPASRDIVVYLPPGYDSTKKHYPVVYLLSGFTGRGIMNMNESFLSENIKQRLDRLISTRKMQEMIVVMPDCTTKFGGSQYLNSTATGKYESYLIQEIVPYIDKIFRTKAENKYRAVCGKSSGGYGAVILAMKHPDVFLLCCSTSGDMAFEYCYLPEFPKFVMDIEPYGKGHKAVVNFIKKELNYNQPKPRSFHNIINTLGMASSYSPNPFSKIKKGYAFDLPVNIMTGELDPSVMERWFMNDPVIIAEKYKNNLKKLKLLFLDAGTTDEFNLQIGARILSDKLKNNKVSHIHEEFKGGHFNIQYRYDRTFSLISSHI